MGPLAAGRAIPYQWDQCFAAHGFAAQGFVAQGFAAQDLGAQLFAEQDFPAQGLGAQRVAAPAPAPAPTPAAWSVIAAPSGGFDELSDSLEQAAVAIVNPPITASIDASFRFFTGIPPLVYAPGFPPGCVALENRAPRSAWQPPRRSAAKTFSSYLFVAAAELVTGRCKLSALPRSCDLPNTWRTATRSPARACNRSRLSHESFHWHPGRWRICRSSGRGPESEYAQ